MFTFFYEKVYVYIQFLENNVRVKKFLKIDSIIYIVKMHLSFT